MKTKYKVSIIIALISLTGFFTVPFYATNIYCDIFDPDNGGCMRIAGIGMIDYTALPYFVIGHSTANPNECWVQDDEGNITPCKIDDSPILWFPPKPIDSDCDEACHYQNAGNNDDKNVKIKGNMAERICKIIGGECPEFFPGNMQDDGSIMVGFVISKQDVLIRYQLFITNDTLRYDETALENEN